MHYFGSCKIFHSCPVLSVNSEDCLLSNLDIVCRVDTDISSTIRLTAVLTHTDLDDNNDDDMVFDWTCTTEDVLSSLSQRPPDFPGIGESATLSNTGLMQFVSFGRLIKHLIANSNPNTTVSKAILKVYPD